MVRVYRMVVNLEAGVGTRHRSNRRSDVSATEWRRTAPGVGVPYQQGDDNNPGPECGGSEQIQKNVTCPERGGTGVVRAAGGG